MIEYEFEFGNDYVSAKSEGLFGVLFPSEDNDGSVWFSDLSESEVDELVKKYHKSESYPYRNCYKVRLTFERA